MSPDARLRTLDLPSPTTKRRPSAVGAVLGLVHRSTRRAADRPPVGHVLGSDVTDRRPHLSSAASGARLRAVTGPQAPRSHDGRMTDAAAV